MEPTGGCLPFSLRHFGLSSGGRMIHATSMVRIGQSFDGGLVHTTLVFEGRGEMVALILESQDTRARCIGTEMAAPGLGWQYQPQHIQRYANDNMEPGCWNRRIVRFGWLYQQPLSLSNLNLPLLDRGLNPLYLDPTWNYPENDLYRLGAHPS